MEKDKILVIEDEEQDRVLVTTVLRNEGYCR